MVFVKGQSGNPGGRPKRDWTWSQVLEEVGEEIEPKSGKKFKELVSRRVWIAALNGNMIAAKELFNRMDGMPNQTVDNTHKGNFTINIDELIGLSTATTKTTDGDKNAV